MSKKAELLEAIAGKNRGLLASETDRVKVLTVVEQLEDHNPTPKPLEASDLLEGNWRLLYTNSRELLGLDRLPLSKLGQIYQCIRMGDAKLYNIAEIIGVPFLEGLVTVTAKLEALGERRANVKFERSIIGLQRLLNYSSPSRLIEQLEAGKKFLPIDFSIENRDRSGWVEITYLDEDMRIARGNQGSIFVLTKEKD